MSMFFRVWGAVIALVLGTALPVEAHEINPTIADLTVADGQATLEMRLNLETFLAGIDLDKVENTDEVAATTEYVTLRNMAPEALADRLRGSEAGFLSGLSLRAGGAAVPLKVTQIDVSEVGDIELPRLSRVTMIGTVPHNTASVRLFWGAGQGALILRQQGVETPYTGYLQGGETSPDISVGGGDALGPLQSFAAYIPVGFDHILPKGLDHILFVLGLFFLSLHIRPLLWQISAFTLAHTVTLALGSMGWVSVPASIVEPLIAASIVYVAVENIVIKGLSRWRPVVVFMFGLLHGLGFASVLGEFGLPEDTFIPALLGFNVGVELGQLCVISIAFLTVGFWFGQKPWYRARIATPASCVIALVGAWWFVERVFL